MKKNTKIPPQVTEYKKRVHGLSSRGEGLIFHDDREIEMPFCLPGEVVHFKEVAYKRHKRFYFQNIESPSLEREKPVCKHFTECGGCLSQHMKEPLYKEMKKASISNVFVENGLDTFVIQDPIFVEPGQRRRVNMEAVKKNDAVVLGFHRHKSHQIINLTECHTVLPEIANVFDDLRTALDQILENHQKTSVFMTVSDVGLDFHFEIQGVSELNKPQRDVMQKFAESHDMARLQFRHRKFIDVIHLRLTPTVAFGGVDVAIDAFGFLQASQKADHVLTQLVMEHVDNPTRILDLFCGRGTFTLPLSTKAPVVGYEFDKKALNALDAAVKKSGRPVITHYRNLFDEPLTYSELKDFDTVVIDPPRAGAEDQISYLKDMKSIKKLIYISCQPETFSRDAATLLSGSWYLESVTPVDQFYWTPHMEVVGVFSQKS